MARQDHTPPALDHLVHLVPSLDESIAAYSALGFVVIRGGTHADQLTTNALVIFDDGIYLELIAFVDAKEGAAVTGETVNEFEKRQRGHWWWGRATNWIDWALTEAEGDDLAQRIASINAVSPRYEEPQEGGRKTKRGDDLKWKVTFPKAGMPRGTLPFWCTDVTPRTLRVPPPGSPHPNGSQGIVSLALLYSQEDFAARVEDLAVIFAHRPRPDTANDAKAPLRNAGTIIDGEEAVEFVAVRRPIATQSSSSDGDPAASSQPSSSPLRIKVKRAQDPEERQWLHQYGQGLYEVEVAISASHMPPTAPPDGIERSIEAKGYGRLRLHPTLTTVVPSQHHHYSHHPEV
ncbi:unnamed protein product [Jaminaea pallidilutea]